MEVNPWFLFGNKRGIHKWAGSGALTSLVNRSGCQGVHSEEKEEDSILLRMQTGTYCVSRKDGHLPF